MDGGEDPVARGGPTIVPIFDLRRKRNRVWRPKTRIDHQLRQLRRPDRVGVAPGVEKTARDQDQILSPDFPNHQFFGAQGFHQLHRLCQLRLRLRFCRDIQLAHKPFDWAADRRERAREAMPKFQPASGTLPPIPPRGPLPGFLLPRLLPRRRREANRPGVPSAEAIPDAGSC